MPRVYWLVVATLWSMARFLVGGSDAEPVQGGFVVQALQPVEQPGHFALRMRLGQQHELVAQPLPVERPLRRAGEGGYSLADYAPILERDSDCAGQVHVVLARRR